MEEVSTIGLDLAKNVFQATGLTRPARCWCVGSCVGARFLSFFARLQPCLIGNGSVRHRSLLGP
jgi:transposase